MHYFGIAVCKDGTSVDELMRKFDDNLCVEWVDAREHEDAAYRNGTVTAFKMQDGTLRSRYDEDFAVYGTSADGIPCVRYECPDGCEEVVVGFAELYPDYDEYLKDWCGYREDPERGIGSWENPDGHYDYYRVGGRWSGGIAATDGSRAASCWEVDGWLKDHPGESWYGEHQFDMAKVDDMIRGEQHAPAFFVTPDGEWFDSAKWGCSTWEPDGTDDHRFWEMCIEPLVGYGRYTAYVIDAHC